MPQSFTAHLENAATNPAPTITLYHPAAEHRTGTGLIIFPGGGYQTLAAHEGEGYAEFFCAAGIACFVVEYRLTSGGFKHPAMIEDAMAAISTVRARAEELGVDARKIGVIGSSAGGHLAAHALTQYHQYESAAGNARVSLRPDFGVLCYPVVSLAADCCHVGSRRNLIGENPTGELQRQLSPELNVTAHTPPCFIWHTYEDEGVGVENSLLMAGALRRQGVPLELHVYQRGRHGLGLNTDFAWGAECVRWIKDITSA